MPPPKTNFILCTRCRGLGYKKKWRLLADHTSSSLVYEDCSLCNSRGWRYRSEQKKREYIKMG